MLDLIKIDVFPYEFKRIECLSWFECYYLDLIKDNKKINIS